MERTFFTACKLYFKATRPFLDNDDTCNNTCRLHSSFRKLIVLSWGRKVPFSPLLKIGCKISVHLPVAHDDDDDDVYHDDDDVDNN